MLIANIDYVLKLNATTNIIIQFKNGAFSGLNPKGDYHYRVDSFYNPAW